MPARESDFSLCGARAGLVDVYGRKGVCVCGYYAGGR